MDDSRQKRAGAAWPLPRPQLKWWRVEAMVLLNEIVDTGEAIARARDWHGELIAPRDASWSLLRAIERAQYRPSISDLGRRLGISRQAAHELVRRAAKAGHLRLLTNDTDRRIVQVQLTGLGRYKLEWVRAREAQWVITLLNGLRRREMESVMRILRVIRHQLLGDERQLREARRDLQRHLLLARLLEDGLPPP